MITYSATGGSQSPHALDTDSNKPVAIKEYLPEELALRIDTTTVRPKSPAKQDQYQQCLNRFHNEALALARFKHPHINKVKNLISANDTAYIVLEYIEGEILSEVLKRDNRLAAPRLRRLLDELLSGLEAVHGEGLVHRDIKPGNIMLRPDGSAVLLDFGAARQTVGQSSESISTGIYTPGYAAIEQDGGKVKDLGPWTDLYALGRVAYRSITGLSESEIPGARERERLAHKGESSLASAVEAGKGRYDEPLLQAVDWAFRVDKDQRPQNVAELREVLAGGNPEEARDHALPSAAIATPSIPPAPAPKKKKDSKEKSWRANINPKLIGTLALFYIAVIIPMFLDPTSAAIFLYPLGNFATALTVRLSNQHNARIIAVIAAIITVGLAWYLKDIHNYPSSPDAEREIIALCIAYLPGQLLNIAVFQKIRERSTRWWLPPMISILFANTIYLSIFFPFIIPDMAEYLSEIIWWICIINIISIIVFLPAYGILLHYIKRKRGRPEEPHR